MNPRVVNVPSNMRPHEQMMIVVIVDNKLKYILMPHMEGYTHGTTFRLCAEDSTFKKVSATNKTTKWHNVRLYWCMRHPWAAILNVLEDNLVQLDPDHEYYKIHTTYTVLVGLPWFDSARDLIERLVTNAIYNMPVMKEARKVHEARVRKRLRTQMR